MSELDNAINSINASATKASKTASFLDQLGTYDENSNVTNPNNGAVVPSIQKKVKDTTNELFSEAETSINEAVNTVNGAVKYAGEFSSGVTSAVAGNSYNFDDSYWICLVNTTSDPSYEDANWRRIVSDSDIKASEERSQGVGVRIYRGTGTTNGQRYVQNGDTVPVDTTHLSVLINGKVENVALSELADGVVSSLTETSATIGTTDVTLHQMVAGIVQATDVELATIIPRLGEPWFNTTDNSIHMGDGVTPGGVKQKDAVNVKNHGAKGDGVSDDTAAFVAARSVSDSIYVPEGSYVVNPSELTVKYYGEGIINGVPVANPAQGTSNTVFGFDAGKNFAGDHSTANNTLIGGSCGRELTTGTKNTAVGQGVFSGNTLTTAGPEPMTGADNVGIGFHALKKMEGGSFNVGIGTDAGNELKSGGSNTCVGGSSGQQLTIGFDNTLIGRSAGLRLGLDASSLDPDTYVDLNATGNTAVGRDALRNGYDCNHNTVLGYQAMRGTKDESDFSGNITGDFNIAIGYRAMYTGPINATANVVIGTEALREAVDNSNNVIVGHQAARDASAGSNAVVLGSLAYRSVADIDDKFVVANQSGLAFLDGLMGPAQDAGNYLRVDGNFSPQVGSTRTCGTSTRPWTTVFADNGTIQPSDSRLKTDPEDIPDSVFMAWGNARKNIKMWRWLRKAGDGGDRLHIGPIAQELFAAFEAEGVDPFDFGFACADPVFDVVHVMDGDELVEIRETASIDPDTGEQLIKYSLRQNELFMLEIAYQVWKGN